MLSYEKYEKNIYIDDKYSIKDINIDKCFTYKGDIELLDRANNEDSNFQMPPLAAAVVGIDNTAAPLPQNLDSLNLWTEIDAQEAYLNRKPASYLIIGKPGLGSYTLGESLSKKLNSIHLSPRSVLLEEIEQKSKLGRCLDFNMRHNKVCEFDIILAIMQTKIKSSVIKHRGFIISGLPLVTSSKKEQHLLTSLYTEESLVIVDDLLYDLIVNLKRKKAKQKVIKLSPHSSLSSEVDNAEEQGIEEEQQPEIETEEIEELSVEMPKYLLDICSDVIISHKNFFMTKKSVLLQQLLELFNFEPDIVIHVISPDTDTITKKSRKFFNYFNNLNTFHPFIPNIESEIRWPNKYTMIDYSNPHDSHVFNPKYNIKLPINFKSNSLSQICNYATYINPFVDQKFKDFDPCYILKVDGRTSVYQMLNYILAKLLLMPIQLVLIPKPLYLEEPPEDLEELWNTIKQFNTIKSGVLNFNRYASLWNTRCPVELMKRRSVQGKSKLAVSLFKYVFLLSSLDAMISFCKNPRPFLKLEYLEPTCRIIIMGTKSTGKSMIANCLSWLFDTSIICYKDFLNNERQKKYDSFSKSILSEIIATIEDARLMKWQSAEEERISNLNKWVTNVQTVLQNYISLMDKYQEPTEEENVIPETDLQKMDLLSKQLSFLPILDDLELCKKSILNTDLINYAPLELTTETSRPKVPILGDDDVVEAISSYIVANELQKDIEPTAEELMNEMTQIITTIDFESLEKNEKYGKFIIDGFPCDKEFWGHLDTAKLLPDYTIVLIENKEIDIELLKTYSIIDKSIKNYQERYSMSPDPLVKLKKRHKMPSKNTSLDIDMILHELLNGVFELVVIEDQFVDNTAEMIGPFNEAIDKFREEWESVKLKLEENWKAVIIVEMENKSDIDIVDEVLLKLRQSYCLSCTPSDSSEMDEKDDEYNAGQDMLTYNDSCYFGETNIFCPIAYYDYGVIWEGKSEFCTQFDNKSYYFCKEEYLDLFQKDVTKYQSYNKPFKSLPPLRISIIGSIGSGKSTLSKQIAKELGLIHIDFAEFLNSYLLPKHFKKVGRQYENSFKDTPIDNEAVMELQVGEENDKMVAYILGNESEIRLVLYNYFEKGAPFISSLMQKAIRFLWHTSPFSKIGIVLDGFPKLPSDFEDMIACSCIPDIIIDLQGSSEKTLERLSPNMFKKWKMQLNEAKNEVKMKFEKEWKQWLDAVTKEVVLQLIIDEIFNNIFTDMVINDLNPEHNTSIQSIIIDANPSGSANVDVNLFNTYNEVIKTNPEPVDESQWEKAEDALERINTRLESIFEIDDENIQMLKENLEEHKVKNESVNVSRVPVPDERFDYLCQFHKPASKVPAFLNVVDIAGLVRGAAEGQGLGNAFLSHIKACDAIFNLCRAFEDEDVIHVDGDVNPVRDLETIGEELRLKDEEQLLQNIEKLDRNVNRGEKKLKPEYDALLKIKTVLVDEKKHIRFGDWSAADIEVLNKYLFLTSKPALYLVNLSEKDYIRRKNKWLPKLKEWIDKNDPGAPLIPFSGVYESKLLDMEPAEREAFIKENVPSALDKIIVQGYKALQLEYFFTAGPDEVKAWTIQRGTKAPQAAGRIHTDFEKGFIMAEVMHFKDFREEGTEAACKAAGKYRQQGRNYVVEDGDIIFFKFNAGAGLKDAKKK